MTGSASRGRAGTLYLYYHCQYHHANVPVNEAHEAFRNQLALLCPHPEYAPLFAKMVRDAFAASRSLRLDAAQQAKRAIVAKRKEAANIRQTMYALPERAPSFAADLDAAEKEIKRLEALTDTQESTFDLDGALQAATGLLMDAEQLWLRGSLEDRQRLQRLFFPDGVVYNRRSEPEPIELQTGIWGSAYADPLAFGSIILGTTRDFVGEYRTTPNQLIFKPLEPIPVEDSRMVQDTVIKSNQTQQPAWESLKHWLIQAQAVAASLGLDHPTTPIRANEHGEKR